MPARLSPSREELGDPPEDHDVGLAVEPRAAGGAGRLQQSAALVDAEVLDRQVGTLGRDRDREDARARLRSPSDASSRRG